MARLGKLVIPKRKRRRMGGRIFDFRLTIMFGVGCDVR
jgi:bifunctional DNA-binding transcriptional regulator/antitoxin component of YhaV-PrlF toxin-antitoxin module